MKQYHLEGKTLTLNVNKSPLFVRGIMFFFSFLSFTLPLIGILLSLSMDKPFHIGYLVGLFLFGLIGFYLLRISLWNTYGKEIIKLDIPKISYEANYGWFIDGKRSINSEIINYGIKPIGYVEDKKGVLTIGNEKTKIESVVKMPIFQIEELIKTLNNSS
tara:strand:+ start:55 stop:534 length:480 start_codon:yes stop_codon:yes gene_type:complete